MFSDKDFTYNANLNIMQKRKPTFYYEVLKLNNLYNFDKNLLTDRTSRAISLR